MKYLFFFRKMEQRTLVVMAAMGLLNICFGLVDSIQVTFIFFGDLLNIVHISTYFISFIYTYFTYILLIISINFIYKSMRGILFQAPFFPGKATRKGATASQFGPSQFFSFLLKWCNSCQSLDPKISFLWLQSLGISSIAVFT